jgi:hypothetical protein
MDRDDTAKLLDLIKSGATAVRCSAVFNRRITVVQQEARRLGTPFQDIRVTKRLRNAL